MNFKKPDKGLAASASAHLALLLVALVGFSDASKFNDAQESVPVEVITDEQFSQLAKGEKTAKDSKPATKAVKAADITEAKPDAPVNPVSKEVPLPPPPLKRTVDPAEEAKEEPRVPPVKPAAAAAPPKPEIPVPPVRPPEPVRPGPAPPPPPPKAEAKPPPPDKPEAEAVAPLPPVKPPPPKLNLAKLPDPPPPAPAKLAAVKQPDPPPVPEKPKAAPAKPVLDQVASLLKDTRPEPPEKKHPRPVTPAPSAKPFDPNAINSLLQANASVNKPSAAKDPSPTASLGAPAARSQKMPQFMARTFYELLDAHYSRCWDQSGLSTDTAYRPLIRVHFLKSGALSAEPVLANPGGDAKARAMAESAVRAIRSCGPVPVPEKYLAFYDDWKDPPLLQMSLNGDN